MTTGIPGRDRTEMFRGARGRQGPQHEHIVQPYVAHCLILASGPYIILLVLDGIDLVAITPTGSGKTGYLFLTILVMIAIAKTPSLCPVVKFPKDPAIVVVCPTNSIEQQMVLLYTCHHIFHLLIRFLGRDMTKLGVAALTFHGLMEGDLAGNPYEGLTRVAIDTLVY
ncbi:hypothetical protein B0H17DRAFT_1137824 [Mycena rosella]|uniref:DEAD/DEAH box helicase domain-containing protein n=1 Tax=Mycena rosella TaxID=1033263 RepID=A0AAD7GAA2_MYCRO|nr:hypothetical protein B0H17DRAFT_1137824 [Mycena rosella]